MPHKEWNENLPKYIWAHNMHERRSSNIKHETGHLIIIIISYDIINLAEQHF